MQPFSSFRSLGYTITKMSLNQATTEQVNELVKQFKQGDRLAFQKLYELYARAMLNTSFRITNSKVDSEDILQESFIIAFNKIHQFEGKSAFGAWLKRIVINQSINLIQQKRKLHFESTENYEMEYEPEPDDLPYTIDMVNQAIQELPDGYRIIVTLFLFDNYSHQMIAEELGISESGSKSQYSRGRKKLATILTSKVGVYGR